MTERLTIRLNVTVDMNAYYLAYGEHWDGSDAGYVQDLLVSIIDNAAKPEWLAVS